MPCMRACVRSFVRVAVAVSVGEGSLPGWGQSAARFSARLQLAGGPVTKLLASRT